MSLALLGFIASTANSGKDVADASSDSLAGRCEWEIARPELRLGLRFARKATPTATPRISAVTAILLNVTFILILFGVRLSEADGKDFRSSLHKHLK